MFIKEHDDDDDDDDGATIWQYNKNKINHNGVNVLSP